MAEILTCDDIDFAPYLADTDAEHRVITASSYVDDVIDYYHNPKTAVGSKLPFEKTHGSILFRPGEVTLWGGMNGHGKSMLLGQTCLGFIAQQKRICIASMEMKPLVTLARMCRQASTICHPDIDFIRDFHDKTDGFLWLYDQQGTVKAKMILAVLRYCADKLKIDHFVIDSLLKCGIGEDDLNGQKDFIDQLTSAARDTGVHVHLVAHSRKAKDESMAPGKMDVKGSGSITDQVDNILTVWRNKAKESAAAEGRANAKDPDALIICDKQRNGEWEGKIGLWFHPGSMQFLPDGLSVPVNMLKLFQPVRDFSEPF